MHKYITTFICLLFLFCLAGHAAEGFIWLSCSDKQYDKQCHEQCSQLVAAPKCRNMKQSCSGPRDCYHKKVAGWPTNSLMSTLVNTVESWDETKHQYGAFYHSNWYKFKEAQAYLHRIYGVDYQKIDWDNITYFYPGFPFERTMFTRFPKAAYYPEGVPVNKLWLPAFWPGSREYPWINSLTRVIRNPYPPGHGLWNHTYKPLSGRIEIAHMTGDDIGWWAYYTPGSGVYIPLQKTVAVLNKLDYLVSIMHMSYAEIAALPGWDVPDFANPNGNPNGIVFRHWTYLRDVLRGQTITNTLNRKQKLYVTENTSLKDLLRFAVHGDNKWLNILTIGTHYINTIIYEDAKKRAVHSVQFLAQPNPVGGWMPEIFFIVDKTHKEDIKTLESSIELYDHRPCIIDYIPGYPGFGDKEQYLLTCKNLPITSEV